MTELPIKPLTAYRLKLALKMAARNFWIAPLRPGTKEPFGLMTFADAEHPDGQGWFAIKSRDPDVIQAWFKRWPEMNYLCCAGDGGVIIDLDVKHADGVTAFDALLLANGDENLADDTLRVQSPSGGRHVYLTTNRPVGNGHTLPDGIDVRGRAGYVVGPGSVLIAGFCKASDVPGEYAVISEGDEILPCPPWLDACLHSADKAYDHHPLWEPDTPANLERARSFLSERDPAVSGHNANDFTYKTIQHIRDCGVSADYVTELLNEPAAFGSHSGRSWNETCCIIVNGQAQSYPWSDAELERLIQNAYKYGQNRVGDKTDLVTLGANGEIDAAPHGLEEHPPFNTAIPLKFNSPEEIQRGLERLRAITHRGANILTEVRPIDVLIQDWLLAQGMTALVAYRGRGKSTVLTHMGLMIAHDRDWAGIPVDKDWVVVYVAGEDAGPVRDVVAACCKVYDLKLDPERFILLDGTVDLLDPKSVELWTIHIMTLLKGRRCVVFLDTWQRATIHAEDGQAGSSEMARAVEHAEALAKSVRGPVVAAFHPPKGERDKGEHMTLMGASELENVTKSIWALYEPDKATGALELKNVRMKGEGGGEKRTLQLDTVELEGEADKFGRMRKARLPVYTGGRIYPGMPTHSALMSQDSELWCLALKRLLEIEVLTLPLAARDPGAHRAGFRTDTQMGDALASKPLPLGKKAPGENQWRGKRGYQSILKIRFPTGEPQWCPADAAAWLASTEGVAWLQSSIAEKWDQATFQDKGICRELDGGTPRMRMVTAERDGKGNVETFH